MSGPLQWTPNGMVPAGSPPGTEPLATANADEDDDDQDDELPVARPLAARVKPKAKPVSPKDIVRMARARVREIRIELRAKRNLEKELAELERLIGAATTTPLATVREIKRSAG